MSPRMSGVIGTAALVLVATVLALVRVRAVWAIIVLAIFTAGVAWLLVSGGGRKGGGGNRRR
jgi:multisubunit Na+/H+ antiporter MnhC subunit